MTKTMWHGVMPAITTPFREDGSVDLHFLGDHAKRMVDAGATGIVPLGSLGEGATLDLDEKEAVIGTLVDAVGARVPVVPGIAALSTRQAVHLAQRSRALGCRGLMVLPPYVYKGDWREMKAHVDAIFRATPLEAMLYNNPIAYGTDFLPEQIAALAAEHPNLRATKDSSGDVRRITAVKALVGDRLAVFVGLDDCALEGAAAGASGWIAGLVNALPEESMRLFELALAGNRAQEAKALYRWFLPLLRLDTVPTFVQLIKLVQQEVGLGSERVRPPRLPLEGAERDTALRMIRKTLSERPR